MLIMSRPVEYHVSTFIQPLRESKLSSPRATVRTTQDLEIQASGIRRRSGDRGQRIGENKNAEKEHRGEFRPGMRYHGHMIFSGAAAKLEACRSSPS